MTWPRYFAVLFSLILGLTVATPAQTRPVFSGLWVVDPDRRAAGDVYGELRFVTQDEDAIRVSMIDYGSASIGGRFRDVVRIMPWTFRFGEWGPRRGGANSSQPKARARWEATGVTLAKSTERGNGDFQWTWSLSGDRNELLHRESAGDVIRFFRASDSSIAKLQPPLPAVEMLVVRLSPDATTLLVSCPMFDCRLVSFYSGQQQGISRIPRGAVVTVGLDAEVRVEPMP